MRAREGTGEQSMPEGAAAYRRILVGLDGSEAAMKALRAALELARTLGAQVHAVGVEERLPQYAATVGEVEEAKAEQDSFFEEVMLQAREAAQAAGVKFSHELRIGNAPQQIVQAAREGGFELVVLGAKGHSIIREFLLGTTTDRVIRHAPCSVLVVR